MTRNRKSASAQPMSADHFSDLAKFERIKRLSRFLDSSIPVPGTPYRIGIDPLLGLIPGVGDMLGALLSSYIVLLAVSMGISHWTLLRMLLNILVESVVGAIPIVGDVFDAVWKANERNRILLEKSLLSVERRKVDRRFVVLLLLALLTIIGLALWLALQLLSAFISLLQNSL